MNMKLIAVIALVAAAGIFFAYGDDAKPQADPRIDKVLEQNTQILKNQETILNELKDLKEGILQLRRRSS